MMGRRSNQTSLFDASALVQGKIDPDSLYALLHAIGPVILSDDDFAEMYNLEEGRPSLPPSLLAQVLLLQRHDNVSDREAVARLKFDLRWQYALRLPVGYPGFAHANLCHFRSRLIVHGLERLPFEKLTELAVETGLLDPSAPQAIDSSHIFGAAAVEDTYRLLRGGLRRLLAKLVACEPQWGASLIEQLDLSAYQSPEKPEIAWDEAETRADFLKQIVGDSRRLLAALDGVARAEIREAASLLIELLDQDITTGDAGEPEIKQGVAKDRTISTTDPEMRHGRKSSSKRFDGYKVHLTESLDSEIITDVAVTPGNAHDAEAAAEMLQRQEQALGSLPEELLGDTHYGSADTRVELAALGVEVIAKLPPNPQAGRGRFAKEAFLIDLEQETVTCPAGHTTDRFFIRRDAKKRPVTCFQFDADLCRDCALREQCTTSKNGRTITLHYHQAVVDAARAYNQSEEFKQKYRRRALIERKLSEMLWRHGLRFGRYFGRKKTELQALLVASVVNLKRIGRLLCARLKEAMEIIVPALRRAA
jgi:transposase/IS5 family transposase